MKRPSSWNYRGSSSYSWGNWLGGGAIATVMVVCPTAQAALVSSWMFNPMSEELSVVLPPDVTPRFLVFAEPARIVLEIPDMQLGQGDFEQAYHGDVRLIQVTQHDPNTVRMTLVLAPNAVLDPHHAQLTSIPGDGQTRWVLTPLVVHEGAIATATPTPASPTNNPEPQALPDLPAVTVPSTVTPDAPAADPATATTVPSSPAATPSPSATRPTPASASLPTPSGSTASTGRLSTSASNLMLSAPTESFDNLPDTLAIDPFAQGDQASAPVSVPPLADSAAPVSMPPLEATATATPDTVDSTATIPTEEPGAAPTEEPGIAIATIPPLPAENTAEAEDTTAATTAPNSNPIPDLASEPVTTAPDPADALTPPSAEAIPPVESRPLNSEVAEANDIPADPDAVITIPPPGRATATAPSPTAATANPIPETPAVEATPPDEAIPTEATESVAIAPDAIVIPESPPFLEDDPLTTTPTESGNDASRDAALPPALPVTQLPPVATTTAPSAYPPPVEFETATVPSLPVPATPNATTDSGVIAFVPPTETNRSSLPDAGAIPFGEPLPNATGKALESASQGTSPYVDPATVPPRPIAPEVLLPAGTVLQLRYPGRDALTLDNTTTSAEVMILAADLRDPRTNAVIAPAGTQIAGKFEPDVNGQRWVSEALILPDRQLTLASASEYMVGPPEVSGGNLALNTGIGALALTVLTGFTGIGLLGGAVLGATTTVGMSPQHVTIEPNQMIEVRVLEDVPRSALQWP